MIPPLGTPASELLEQIRQWGKATAVLDRLQVRLTDYEVPFTSVRENGRPRPLIGEKLTVWAGRTGQVIHWGPELDKPAEEVSFRDLDEVAGWITERVHAALATAH
ncbi:hypothetical protein ACWDR1_32075 [Streptosporangium sandarakinum]